MRNFFFILVFFLIIPDIKGQLLNPPETRSLVSWRKFNPRFIEENEIKEIRTTEEFKPDGEKIKRTGFYEIFKFDRNGRLVGVSRIISTGDTLTTTYTYTGNRLECEVKNDAAGMFSYCYTYAEDGRPSSVKYARLGATESARPTKITTEKYEHKTYEGQLHTTLFNGSGRPYQKEFRYFDENGYLMIYLKTFVMTRTRVEEKYGYNEHGYLSTKEVSANNRKVLFTYEYDEVGNLLAEEKWEGEVRSTRKEYVYRPEDMLIKAELVRDEILQAIRITGYEYSFY